jgi:hypothetical protein
MILTKLLPMTDFVLNVNVQDTMDLDAAEIYRNYAKFLKQPLTMGMFFPCDENNNPLEMVFPLFDGTNQIELIEYHGAKDRVLFKGFTIVKDPYWGFILNYKGQSTAFYAFEGKSVEFLLTFFQDIELTSLSKIKFI